ncbi:MAG: hypothetical protein JNM01_12555 [Delftia acidovorans]|nr:hypothetical protein [Delftia acidovorans]
MSENSSSPKKPADWERIELDYRAGIKTLRQIADENGITHGAINKRAKRDGWERDLGVKIQAKADALVSKAAVSSEVSTDTKVRERAVIDANAQAVADVRLAHRRDIQRARRITNTLLDELEKQTDPDTLVLLGELGEMLRQPDDNGQDRLNDLYHKVISLSERSKTMKTLAESLQKLVDMERTAFGMDKMAEKVEDPLSLLLARIASGNSNGFKTIEDDPEAPARGSNSIMPRQTPDDEDD